MVLSFVSQNTQFGGLRDDSGKPEDRWPQLLERITSVYKKPDFVLVQEAESWSRYNHKALARACKDLGMAAMPLPFSTSGNLPALLYRPETVGQWVGWNDDYSKNTVHGFGVAAFDIGLPSPLAVASVHLNFFSADLAIKEAALVANRSYSYGPFAVFGGDINYHPGHDPEPDFEAFLPYHYSMRTNLTNPAKHEPVTADRRVAWKLEQAGFVDVAYKLYQETEDEKHLQKTAPDSSRIDQFWVSEPLRDAIVDYQVISEPKDASDHKGVAFQLDTDRVDTSNAWRFH